MVNFIDTSDVDEVKKKVRELNDILAKTFSSKISLEKEEVDNIIRVLSAVPYDDGIVITSTPTSLGVVITVDNGMEKISINGDPF